MPVPYEAILFDFDGVLADTEPVHFECWREVLAEFGIGVEWPRYEREFLGIADRDMIARLCRDAGVDVEAVMAQHPRKKELFRERMSAAGAIPGEVIDLLLDLKNSYRLGMVTSSGRIEIEPILQRAGILEYFGATVYGGDVQRLKPAPDPYLLAAERLGASSALVVEDSEPGMASGRAAGFDVLFIKYQPDMPRLVRRLLQTTPVDYSVR